MDRGHAHWPERETERTNLLRRLEYAQALHRCAEALLQPATDETGQRRALTEALAHLRTVAAAGRASLFQNFTDEHCGFASRMIAESNAPGIPSNLEQGFAACIPWASIPIAHMQDQAAGLPVGGPTSRLFAAAPNLRDRLLADGILSIQFFPVLVSSEWWGYISFDDYNSAREWDEEELLLQRTAAAMIGGALRRWHIEGQLQAAHDEAIVLHERQRLARELHDALTQSIYSITLFARAGSDALEGGNIAKTQAVLQAMEATAQQTLVEMRLLLFELQPLDLTQRSLAEALEARFSLVERRLGLAAEYVGATSLSLPRALQHAMLRIALEALNNALKHAAASRVSVQVAVDAARITMVVADDGCGFDPQQCRAGLGMRTMQERAASIGGALRIESQPGAGARLVFSLPHLFVPAEED